MANSSVVRLFSILLIVLVNALNGYAVAATSQELYPLTPFNKWTFLENNSVEVSEFLLPGTVTINGVVTRGILDSEGDIAYYSNDDQGLRLHRIKYSDGDMVTFSPPAKMLNVQPEVGDNLRNTGIATISIPNLGTVNVQYTYNLNVAGVESVIVPAGSFEAYRIDESLRVFGSAAGLFIDVSSSGSTWLAAGIGEVKSTTTDEDGTFTWELQSFVNQKPEIVNPLENAVIGDSVQSVGWDAMGLVPQNWAVTAGTQGAGSSNILNSGALASGVNNRTIAGLPVTGIDFTISLYVRVNSTWFVADSVDVTAFTAPSPQITSPASGMTLGGSSVMVNWDAMGLVPQNWAVTAGTLGAGSTNIINSGALGSAASSHTIGNLPVDGSAFTISLYTRTGGVWQVVDSVDVTAFTAPSPQITSPASGMTLGGSSVMVNWDAMGLVPQNWAVTAGTLGAGSTNIINSGALGSAASSHTIGNLPVDGSAFTISLYTRTGGVWQVVDSVDVTAFTAPSPQITSPASGMTLGGSSVMVNWDAMGLVPQNWAVTAGTLGAGSTNIINSGALGSAASSHTIGNLPVDGSAFTISLYARTGGVWQVVDSVDVTAFTAPSPQITSPASGMTLGGNSVTVNWDAMGLVPQNWAVTAGTLGAGSTNIINSGALSSGASSRTIGNLPTDGSAFTISLYTRTGGVWRVVDSVDVVAADL